MATTEIATAVVTSAAFNTTEITAIASVSIALLALIVSLWSMVLQRAHNRRSVTPHIDILYGRTDFGIFALHMINNGIGPARITEFTVLVDDKPVSYMLHQNIWESAGLGMDFSLPDTANVPVIGQLVAKDSSLLLLDYGPEFDLQATVMDVSQLPTLTQKFENALARLSITVGYESLYGDPFIATWKLHA